MNSQCESCGTPIVGEPHATNRHGDFCSHHCVEMFLGGIEQQAAEPREWPADSIFAQTDPNQSLWTA